MRLQKYLSQAGVAARRKAEAMITAGRVKVNGKVVTTLGSKIDPDRDRVAVDDAGVEAKQKYYYLLNKPKGYVTTVSDPEGRHTVMELLPQLPAPIRPVGRLDFYTEGVLLLTNDGELQDALLAPRADIEKTYHAKLRGEPTMADIEKLRAGVKIREQDGRTVTTLPAKVDVLRRTGTHTWLVISIREGRSRQIHRMAEAVGHEVLKLARVAFAGLTFHGLKIGECRPLEMSEVHELRVLAGLDANVDAAPSPPREKRKYDPVKKTTATPPPPPRKAPARRPPRRRGRA
jgi:pseudouridine synthase